MRTIRFTFLLISAFIADASAQGFNIEQVTKDSASSPHEPAEHYLSQWIKRFIVYPREARTAHLEGSVMMRMRIDDKGTITYYKIERSSGHPILDNAAMDIVRRATPLADPLPDSQPGRSQEFILPITFRMPHPSSSNPEIIRDIRSTNSSLADTAHNVQSTNTTVPTIGDTLKSTMNPQ